MYWIRHLNEKIPVFCQLNVISSIIFRMRSFRVQLCSITFISSMFIHITKHILRMVFQQDVVEHFSRKKHRRTPIVLLQTLNYQQRKTSLLHYNGIATFYHTYFHIILTIFLHLNFVIDKYMIPHVAFETLYHIRTEKIIYTFKCLLLRYCFLWLSYICLFLSVDNLLPID